MNFEEAYRKLQDGTASPEEMKYVTGEIEKARAVSNLLDSIREAPPLSREVPEETVRRARRVFDHRTLIRTVLISLSCVLLLGAITCGILFIPSTVSARADERLSRDEAVAQAKACVSAYCGEEAGRLIVHDVDKKLYLGNGLGRAYYFYEVELRTGDNEYQVNVNAKSGYADIVDIENSF